MEQIKNEVAVKYGFKDWDSLLWDGDITQNIIDELLANYGRVCREEGFQLGVKTIDINKL